ncbi:hypothetical protein [Streptomyces sp. TRM68367]|uniref:hypothetical protein n=1 Tax=Streptomyces sp. TRM68367 TaxID=2758415 RepID=UPI00165B73D7|nr:hypothetical protein [Streptomyces sp. TRM68367]MBC9731316.1 hypothetical protein [Streptomyces sp. TRM68367]
MLSGLTESLCDTVTGALAPWYRRPDNHANVQDPVSVREHFSMPKISDMHQSDDERRLVMLLQSCVFDAVFGDNLAPIQNITAGQVAGAGQKAASTQADRGAKKGKPK